MELYLEYLRISRTDRLFSDDPLKTLERHEQILLDLQKRNNYHVTEIFKEVVSGDSISDRPEMQKLLKLIETGAYAGVLVMDADRLARGDTIDQGIVSRAFQVTGTKIITPSKIYDPLDEFDNDYFEYALFMGRKEYKMIKKRLNRGRISSATEGKFVGSVPPYGYDKYKLPRQKGYSLIPNANAGTVQKIFCMFNGIGCERTGIKGIASYLNSCGIPGPKGNCWSSNTIGSILKNPVYAGYIRYNYKKEEKVFQNGEIKKIRRASEESQILVQGLHEYIIPEKLFRAAQYRFDQSNRTPKVKDQHQLKNPLSGIVRCAKCGHSLIRKKNGGKDFLICNQYGCDNIGSYFYLIEQELLLFLKEYTKDISPLNCEPDYNLLKLEELKKNVTLEQEKILLLNKKRDKLYDLLEEEIYTYEFFIERKEKLDLDILNLMAHISASEKKLADCSRNQRDASAFVSQAVHILDNYEIMSIEERNQSLKSILDHVDYLKEERSKKNQGNIAAFRLTIYPRI